MLDPYRIIVRPVVSEKSTALGEAGKYVFEVAPDGEQDPDQRRRRGRLRGPQGRGRLGQHPAAPGQAAPPGAARRDDPLLEEGIVTLRPGQRLDLFEGV